MNFSKYIERAVLVILFMLAVALLIVPHLEPIPREARFHVVWIVCISFVCAILLFFLFLTPFGFGNITELIQFAHALQVLKRDDIQKNLSELKELPNITKILRMEIINKLKIIEDYNDYIHQKKANSIWVIGASLRNPESVKSALEKGIECEYLFAGSKKAIDYHAEIIVKNLGEKANEYITNGAVKIYCIESHPVQVPKTFYDATGENPEVLIFFPYEIEDIMGKYAILVNHTEVVRKWAQEYIEIKARYEKDKLGKDAEILKKFITKA